MYRARVGDGEMLPWVSNATPDLMNQVYEYFHLDGGLDTNSGNAGTTNTDDILKHFEIRIFKDNELGGSEPFTGGEVDASMSYMVDNSANWTPFTKSTLSSHLDGIKIQTSANKNYYLSYKTWNAGRTDYYPAVKSTIDDYAGSAGKPIQRLNIQVYKNDGTKLTSGVIVMYRAYVADRWLPWVSNADPDWMRGMQSKYSLDGTLDISGSYAGMDGQNISGIEIRIFEDDSSNPGSGSFTGREIDLSMRYMADNNWNSFSKNILAEHMDAIEIRTGSGNDFYLSYRTWNSGQSSYYPDVISTEDNYAGSSGKPIQRLGIHAYKSDGTKLTSGVVVMYRAYVDGRWLPWVSNADPEWMTSVQMQYNLGGTLDTSGGYAGISGKNIAGIEIRAFKGSTTSLPSDNLPGAESAPSLSYMVGGNWQSFSKSVVSSQIDGIKIQTSSGKPYYLLYKTHNAGKTDFYPAVKSTDNDYAGSSGKPIQKLSIYAYKNDGTKLTTGVVVMYRAYVDSRWLPWVSNADPDWMRSAQSKYNLGGTLDTGGYYAGIGGKNIAGIEIRVFEENNTSTTPPAPSGNYKIINAPFITQNGKYPTGCESVSAVMALNYVRNPITVDSFIDNYLEKSGTIFDPDISFGGNPRGSGYGCYAPVIKKALDKILPGTGYSAKVLNDVSLSTLCSRYIDNDIPVIVWATMNMSMPYISRTWTYYGKTIRWVAPEHCLLLVGYDDDNYIFNDPLKWSSPTYYSKSSVANAYKGLFSQAVVIIRTGEPIDPPTPPTPPISPVYKYGAVKNADNGEFYPIHIYERGEYYFEPNYTFEKTVSLNKATFNWAKFISGLKFNNSLINASNHPLVGGLGGLLVGGITSFNESWESLYIDISYFKNPNDGQKKAVIQCGETKYCKIFKDWSFYGIPKSMKGLHGIWTDSGALQIAAWEKAVDDFAKDQYKRFSGVTLDGDYHYDLEFTLDERRKNDKYISYFFLGDDGEMYEYAKAYSEEKIEIIITKGFLYEEVDRLDILPQLSLISKLPQDKAALFDIEVQ